MRKYKSQRLLRVTGALFLVAIFSGGSMIWWLSVNMPAAFLAFAQPFFDLKWPELGVIIFGASIALALWSWLVANAVTRFADARARYLEAKLRI